MLLESSRIGRDKGRPGDASQSATILLVEDEDRVREVMEVALSLSGYKVLATESAIEALEIIETYDETIHLMVTDFAMPYMNGADLAVRLKRARPRTKVLYVSGFPKQDVQDFHEMNGRTTTIEFLQKPFMPDELEIKVHTLLADAH
ncbi:MAG TPA: response regulator [Pyrinomonadaceae bacterium]|jgi:DNA-binding NtrC family response regulator